jgi:predicted DNA-binding ribbon-helix-helix protein
MAAVQKPRNVRLHGRRTSMRLEASFWEALEDIAEARNRSVESICENIAARLHRGNLSSAIRVYVLDWWRKRAAPTPGLTLAEKLGKRAPPAPFAKFLPFKAPPTKAKSAKPKSAKTKATRRRRR